MRGKKGSSLLSPDEMMMKQGGTPCVLPTTAQHHTNLRIINTRTMQTTTLANCAARCPQFGMLTPFACFLDTNLRPKQASGRIVTPLKPLP